MLAAEMLAAAKPRAAPLPTSRTSSEAVSSVRAAAQGKLKVDYTDAMQATTRVLRSWNIGSPTCHKNSTTTIAMGMPHSKKRMMTPPACEPPASCEELVVERFMALKGAQKA